jgi:hypothetical protein
MFGGNPLPFYAYNVASAALGVLFGEPRDGVWRVTRSVLEGGVDVPRAIVAVSSTFATLLIAWSAWHRRRAWRARRFDRRDQLLLLFGAVLAANSAISFAYTKDVIMSPAGLFFAAALFAAACDLLDRLPRADRRTAALALSVLAVVSCTWAIRAVGIHAALARTGFQVREQWAYVDDWLARSGFHDMKPSERALLRHLRDDAVIRHPARPPIDERWTRLFEID